MSHLKKIKNIKQEIGERRDDYIYADMHAHTRYSDGFTTLAQAKAKIRKYGIHVAITDHNEVRGALALSKIKSIKDWIIPGIEITPCERFHLIFYFHDFKTAESFFNKEIKRFHNRNPNLATSRTAQTYLDLKDKYNAISCLPHPYSPFAGGLMNKIHKHIVGYEILKQFDWIEAINALQTIHENTQSKHLASLLKKPHTAGSDSHDIRTLGKALTYCKADNKDQFFKQISKQKNEIIGVHLNVVTKTLMGTKLTLKHLKYFEPTVEYKYNSMMESINYYGQLFEHRVKRKMKKWENELSEKE